MRALITYTYPLVSDENQFNFMVQFADVDQSVIMQLFLKELLIFK